MSLGLEKEGINAFYFDFSGNGSLFLLIALSLIGEYENESILICGCGVSIVAGGGVDTRDSHTDRYPKIMKSEQKFV